MFLAKMIQVRYAQNPQFIHQTVIHDVEINGSITDKKGIVPKRPNWAIFKLTVGKILPGLMFEGMDLKCAVVNLTRTQKDPPPCAPYPSLVGSPMPPRVLPGSHGAVTRAGRADRL